MSASRTIENLVCSGCGAAFPALAGAFDALCQNNNFSRDALKRIIGTSSGAIIALLITLGYDSSDIVKQMTSMHFKSFASDADIARLLKTYGLYSEDSLYKLILKAINEKTGRKDPENVSFHDLKKLGLLDLYVVTTKFYIVNGSPIGKKIVFSHEKHGDTAVATAVISSAAGSPYFQGRRLKKMDSTKYVLTTKSDPDADFFTDGGLCDNFAINFFDKPQYVAHANDAGIEKILNHNTLGLVVINKDQLIADNYHPTKEHFPENDILKFSQALLNTLLSHYTYEHLDESATGPRTIEIDRFGVQAFDFNIDKKTIKALIESGRQAVKDYFSEAAPNRNADTEEDSDFIPNTPAKEKTVKCKPCVIL